MRRGGGGASKLIREGERRGRITCGRGAAGGLLVAKFTLFTRRADGLGTILSWLFLCLFVSLPLLFVASSFSLSLLLSCEHFSCCFFFFCMLIKECVLYLF